MYFSKTTIKYIILTLSIVFVLLGCRGINKHAVDSNKIADTTHQINSIVNAGEDKNITLGETITLVGTGSASDSIVKSYSWSENTKILANSKTLEYTPTTIGIHTLTLTVIYDKGKVGSDSVVIVVKNAKIEFTQNDMIVASQDLHDEAVDLQTLIKKTTNLDLNIVETSPAKENYIKLSTDCETPKDGFQLSSGNDREISICAKEKISVSYGVIDLAERYLGIKWLFPSSDDLGIYYPEIHSLIIDREDRVEAPAYKNRRLSVGKTIINGKDLYALWGKRMRLLSSKSAFHHNLYKIYPPEKYRESHPEWYPIHDGIRYPLMENVGKTKIDYSYDIRENHTWQPIFGALGLLEEGIKNVDSYFKENPNQLWFSLGMNDSINWGDEQLLEKPKNTLGFVDMSDYYISWANNLVKKVSIKHPKKKFGFLAYHNIVDPPSVEMNSSLIPFITYDRLQWTDSKREVNDKKRTIQWSEKATELGWYDYIYGDQYDKYWHHPMYVVPRVYPHLMADYLKFGYEHKVRHYYAEAYPDINLWSEGPKLYVLAKLLWNPYADVDGLLQEWYVAVAGQQGATYLKQYFEFWEDFWVNRVPKSPWFKHSNWDYLDYTKTGYVQSLTIQDRVKLQKIMDNLESTKKDATISKRIDFFVHSWNEVRDRAMGDNIDFKDDVVPEGYQLILDDSMEGESGSIPEKWTFWNRPNTSQVLKSTLTDSEHFEGDSSIELTIIPDGKDEAYATLYRSIPILDNDKVCLRVQAKSPDEEYMLGLSFQEEVGTKQKYSIYNLFEATKGNWKASVLCTKLPANQIFKEVTIWLTIKSSKNTKHQVFYDEIELFVK